VQTGKVVRGDITQLVSGSGKIHPEKEVKISAFVSAEIIRLHVNEGDPVNTGKLLVELDRARYEAALERAKSSLTSARANLKKAKAEMARADDLFKRKLYSQAELETVEANYELAQGDVQMAAASLTQAEDDLSKTRLTSPLTGTVAKLNKEEGEIALGSQFQADVIMNVADLTRMEMVADIDENDVVLVSLGDSADIEVDALPDKIYRGAVTEIAHTATTRGLGTQEEVTNFDVKILLSGDVSQLRPGMSATVDIETETHEEVIHVPIQAITMRAPEDTTSDVGRFNETTWRSKQGSSSDANAAMYGPSGEEEGGDGAETSQSMRDKMVQVVFVVDGEHVRMVPVDTGISSEKNVEILHGLEAGQEIVTGSFRALSKTLKSDSKIKINNKAIQSE
jgi:HlyD family secretion protein